MGRVEIRQKYHKEWLPGTWCSQGIYLLPRRLATSSLQEAACMSPVHCCTGTTFPSQVLIVRESSWDFICLTVRGKWKCSAKCPAFSLSAFPRASSHNCQSLLYHQQTIPHWHQGEWDKSRFAKSVTERFWACCSGWGTGWPGTYLAHLLTWTITSKSQQNLEICWNLCPWSLAGTIKGKYRVNEKKPLICQGTSFYPKCDLRD